MRRGRLSKLRRLVNDFDPSRREFLRAALGGAFGLTTAYLASRFTPVAHAETLLPYIKPETIMDKETLQRPYVLVFRDGDYAVAIDENGRQIVRSTDHVKVFEKVLECVQAYTVIKLVGDFIFSKTLTIRKPVVVKGPALLRLGDNVNGPLLEANAIDVKIYDLILDGNAENNPDTPSWAGLILISPSAKNVKICNVKFYNAPKRAINMGAPLGEIYITKCVFEKTGEAAIFFYSDVTKTIRIEGCVFREIGNIAIHGGSPGSTDIVVRDCKFIGPFSGVGNAIDIIGSNVRVESNYIEGLTVGTEGCGIVINSGARFIIKNNIVKNCKRGIWIWQPSGNGVIESNIVNEIEQKGIYVYYDSKIETIRITVSSNIVKKCGNEGIQVDKVFYTSVIGNHVEGCAWGIAISRAGRCKVIGNSSIENRYAGIYLGSLNPMYTVVIGNTVLNNGQDTSAPDYRRAGIEIQGATVSDWGCSHNIIKNNIIGDTQDTPTQTYAIAEHSDGAPLGYNIIEDNVIFGHSLGDYYNLQPTDYVPERVYDYNALPSDFPTNKPVIAYDSSTGTYYTCTFVKGVGWKCVALS